MPDNDAPDSAQNAEAQLVARAKERSPSAWGEIYDAYYEKLYRYCYARTTNDAIAAELVSTVYFEALKGIDKYVFRGRPLLAWLYRIARNVVADHLRSAQREREAVERASALSPTHESGPAAQVTDQQDVLAALSQLTNDQQQVVALRYYAGLSTKEIAEAMERSERAVYSLEVRALDALRGLLAPGRIPAGKRGNA